MTKNSKPASGTKVMHKQAVIYARVSSKEQEKEGFSIPAQLKLLKEYAAAQGFAIAHEYVDVETAKQTGRVAFGEMVAYLKNYPAVRVLLVEKTDRLYRNLKDWVTVDELDLEMHFPKEGAVLSRESRSSEKFMHGIKVLMAKNYIDNLSEEARKGMQEKAEQGIWPTIAPLGYRNVAGADGKKIIEPDPDVRADHFSAVRMVRDRDAVAERSSTEGEGGRARLSQERGAGAGEHGSCHVTQSALHGRVRMEWACCTKGKHQSLVSGDLWERVQGVLDGRHAKKHRRVKHDFAFSALIACGHCGCSIVGEIKKRRYVYYHCTGYKGWCNGAWSPMCARRSSGSSSRNCLAGWASTRRSSLGCAMRCKPATPTKSENTKRQLAGSVLNTTGFRAACMPCMWISSMERWTPHSLIACRPSGAPSRIGVSAKLSGTKPPIGPILRKASGYSNSRAMRNGCSRSKNRAKSVASSIS